MALIEKIQANLAARPETPGAQDQTRRAAGLLAARSGKQVGAPAPMSNLAEQMAGAQTEQQAAQVQQQGQVAAAELGQQQTALAEAERGERADIGLRQKQVEQRASQQKQQILRDLGQGRRTLDAERDRAKLEQLSHTMALGDKQYTDRLQLEGKRARLDDELAFREALQKSIFGSNTDLLKQSLGNKDILEADDREFREMMSGIDIDFAMEMANNELADAKKAAMISGATTLATSGLGAYGTYAGGGFDQGYQDAQGSGYKGTYNQYQNLQTAQQSGPPAPGGNYGTVTGK